MTPMRIRIEDRAVADQLAELITREVRAGGLVDVNGRRVTIQWPSHDPAAVWQNGTLQVSVEGRARGTVGTVWAKRGQVVDVEGITWPGPLAIAPPAD